ncbi:hypothetical protein D6N97_22325 [Salmonella enterica]|nr:hypothetical protein [Salmonella enterica]
MSTKSPQDEPDGGSVIKRRTTITPELFAVTEFVQNKMLISDIPVLQTFNILTTDNGAGGQKAIIRTVFVVVKKNYCRQPEAISINKKVIIYLMSLFFR